MKARWLVPLLSVLASTVLAATVSRLEFDGRKWRDGEGRKVREPSAEGGLVFVAGAEEPLGRIARGMGWGVLQARPVRFEVRGGDGVDVTPLPDDRRVASTVILAVCDREETTVVCLPAGEPIDGQLLPMSLGTTPAAGEVDESFRKAVRDGIREARKRDEVPRFVLVVRSVTRFDRMVSTLRHLVDAGCASGLVRVDDQVPDMSIKVAPDPAVAPPVPGSDPEGTEAIIVEIRPDGSMTAGDGAVLADEAALRRHLKTRRSKIEAGGRVAKLRLRGDRGVLFQHARKVIRVAADEGVDQVVFEALRAGDDGARDEPGGVGERDHPLEMKLPAPAAVEPAPAVDVTIVVDGRGRVSRLNGVGVLDEDPGLRELPGLKKEMEGLLAAAGGLPENVTTRLQIDPDCPQRRVIDVLNVLAGLGIGKVTFVESP